jgi:hypothetical protein
MLICRAVHPGGDPSDSGILLPQHDADPECEVQAEYSGPHSLRGQQQFHVGTRARCLLSLEQSEELLKGLLNRFHVFQNDP